MRRAGRFCGAAPLDGLIGLHNDRMARNPIRPRKIDDCALPARTVSFLLGSLMKAVARLSSPTPETLPNFKVYPAQLSSLRRRILRNRNSDVELRRRMAFRGGRSPLRWKTNSKSSRLAMLGLNLIISPAQKAQQEHLQQLLEGGFFQHPAPPKLPFKISLKLLSNPGHKEPSTASLGGVGCEV